MLLASVPDASRRRTLWTPGRCASGRPRPGRSGRVAPSAPLPRGRIGSGRRSSCGGRAGRRGPRRGSGLGLTGALERLAGDAIGGEDVVAVDRGPGCRTRALRWYAGCDGPHRWSRRSSTRRSWLKNTTGAPGRRPYECLVASPWDARRPRRARARPRAFGFTRSDCLVAPHPHPVPAGVQGPRPDDDRVDADVAASPGSSRGVVPPRKRPSSSTGSTPRHQAIPCSR